MVGTRALGNFSRGFFLLLVACLGSFCLPSYGKEDLIIEGVVRMVVRDLATRMYHVVTGTVIEDRLITTGHLPSAFSVHTVELSKEDKFAEEGLLGFKRHRYLDIGVFQLRQKFPTQIQLPDDLSSTFWLRARPTVELFSQGFGGSIGNNVLRTLWFESVTVAPSPQTVRKLGTPLDAYITGQRLEVGDSGGPLLEANKKTWILRGVASRGPTGRGPFPSDRVWAGSFVSVTGLSGWIRQDHDFKPRCAQSLEAMQTESQPNELASSTE